MEGKGTMHEAELKPCPFCGFEGPMLNDVDQGYKWGRIVCGQCCAKGPEVRTNYESWPAWEPEAAREWNRRTECTKQG